MIFRYKSRMDLKNLIENSEKDFRKISALVKNEIISTDEVENEIIKSLLKKRFKLSNLKYFPYIQKSKILKQVSEISGFKIIDLDFIDFNYNFATKLNFADLIKFPILPINEKQIIIADPFSSKTEKFIKQNFHHGVEIFLSEEEKIFEYLQKMQVENEILGDFKSDLITENEKAIFELINSILENAISKRASDIHVEPTENSCLIRFRIDGILIKSFIFDKEIFNPLSSKIKLLSNLDIAERRIPQDGRFSKIIGNINFDFRVSTLPTVIGESIVLRILDSTKTAISLHSAGMTEKNYERFFKSLKLSHGIILVTGPTGSGKTTTLYGTLNEIKDVKDKIITVEEPVEYQLEMIQQVNVDREAGLDFTKVLRNILRQDPDKIMIGEIRDRETLQIAIEASLTGHLVFSTLHTNDSVSAITRIFDMGIEPYLLSGSLLLVQAQRLVRKICESCKTEFEIENLSFNERISKLIPESGKLYKGKGCNKCSNTGYLGREMICEVLEIDDEIASLISARKSKSKILQKARDNYGFKTMLEIGVEKAFSGVTTIDEVLRVTRS
jgi:general secretion pathway protein E